MKKSSSRPRLSQPSGDGSQTVEFFFKTAHFQNVRDVSTFVGGSDTFVVERTAIVTDSHLSKPSGFHVCFFRRGIRTIQEIAHRRADKTGARVGGSRAIAVLRETALFVLANAHPPPPNLATHLLLQLLVAEAFAVLEGITTLAQTQCRRPREVASG